MRARLASVVLGLSLVASAPASADDRDCACLAVAADVVGSLQHEVAKADALYARGDFEGAFAIYARVHGSAKIPSLVYAQAMAKLRAGAAADAKALFSSYLALGGNLAYRVEAEGRLRDIDGGVVGNTVGAVGGTVGAVGGRLRGTLRGDDDVGVGGAVVGTGAAVTGTAIGVAGDVHGRLDAKAKPPKIARGASIVLGVVAVGAIGLVALQSLRAGISDEIDFDFDPKFHLGLGVSGVVVGATALYVGSLTAATGAVGGVRCAALPAGKPIVAPVALDGGGGVVGAFAF